MGLQLVRLCILVLPMSLDCQMHRQPLEIITTLAQKVQGLRFQIWDAERGLRLPSELQRLFSNHGCGRRKSCWRW